MPQLDITIYSSILESSLILFFLFYSFSFVYLMYPFFKNTISFYKITYFLFLTILILNYHTKSASKCANILLLRNY